MESRTRLNRRRRRGTLSADPPVSVPSDFVALYVVDHLKTRMLTYWRRKEAFANRCLDFYELRSFSSIASSPFSSSLPVDIYA